MATTTTRRPKRERRREIAEAALRLIGEHGVRALSTARLAGAVGLSSGALFRHFSSVDEMLEETVSVAEGLVASTFPPEDLAPLDRLLELARRRVSLVASEPGLGWLLRSDQASTSLPASASVRLRELARRTRAYVLAALADGAADGSIRADVAAEDLIVPVVGTIHTLMGMPGFQELAAPRREQRVEAVLAALATLLSTPSASGSRAGGVTHR